MPYIRITTELVNTIYPNYYGISGIKTHCFGDYEAQISDLLRNVWAITSAYLRFWV